MDPNLSQQVLMDQTEFLNRQSHLMNLNNQSHFYKTPHNQTHLSYPTSNPTKNHHQSQQPLKSLKSAHHKQEQQLAQSFISHSTQNDQNNYQNLATFNQLNDQKFSRQKNPNFNHKSLKLLPQNQHQKSNMKYQYSSNYESEDQDCTSIHTASTDPVDTQNNTNFMPQSSEYLNMETQKRGHHIKSNQNEQQQKQKLVLSNQPSYEYEAVQFPFVQDDQNQQYQMLDMNQNQISIPPDCAFTENQLHNKKKSHFPQEFSNQCQTTGKKCGQQQQQQSVCSSSQISTKKKSTDETKFKTEMCKNFEELGRCNYGKKCKFAHGRHELMGKPSVEPVNYRSKECQSYHTTFQCPYGIRCMFKHDQRTIEEVKQSFFYQKMLYTPDVLPNVTEYKQFHRLPVFAQLQKQYQQEYQASQKQNLQTSPTSDMNNTNFFPQENVCKQLDFSNLSQSQQQTYDQQEQQQQPSSQLLDMLNLNNQNDNKNNHNNNQQSDLSFDSSCSSSGMWLDQAQTQPQVCKQENSFFKQVSQVDQQSQQQLNFKKQNLNEQNPFCLNMNLNDQTGLGSNNFSFFTQKEQQF